MNRPKSKAAALLIGQPWAMKRDVLEHGLSMLSASIKDFQAAAGGFGSAKEGGLYVQDGVAVVDVIGPITRYATCLSSFYGYATVEDAMVALALAEEDSTVRGVVLNINSPGGTVDGTSELADQIAAMTKPVVAYVGGMACSAAYWLASQADSIVTNATGTVGSIGVYAAYVDDRRAYKEAGFDEYVIVSSQSPKKVPDVATDEGRAQIQAHVDALADLFVEAVAKGRGVRTQVVLEKFGQGDVFLGAEAVKRGMADKVGNFSDAFAMLAPGGQLTRTTYAEDAPGVIVAEETAGVAQSEIQTEEVQVMDLTKLKAEHPDVYQAAVAEGAAQECARIAAIDALGVSGHDEIITKAKQDGKSTAADVALSVLKAQKDKSAKIKADREQDAEEVPGVIEQGDEPAEGEKAVGLLKGAFKSKGRK